MADYGPFSPAQINFSGFTDIPESYETGAAFARQRRLRGALGTEEARRALEAGDFGALARLTGEINPEYAQDMLKQGFGGSNNPFGANLYYGIKGMGQDGRPIYGLMAPSKESGQLIESQLPPGFTGVAPPPKFATGPTETQVIGPGGYPMQPPIPKDVQGAAEQRKTGDQIAELKFTLPKVQSHLEMIHSKWGSLKQTIENAKGLVSAGSTGLVGAGTHGIPTSPAYKLKQEILKIQATLAFKELESMRQASPTGSGLGQISNYEDRLLALINGSLEPGVDEQTMRRNLDDIVKVQSELNGVIEREFRRTYGFDWRQQAPQGYVGGPGATIPEGQDPNANLGPNELPISPTPPGGGVVDYQDYFR